MLQDGDFVEVNYCVQFVGYGDDGVTAEFLADDALDHCVGDVVHAEGVGVVSVGLGDWAGGGWVEGKRVGERGAGEWNEKEGREKRGRR